jgi:hypothetical protein
LLISSTSQNNRVAKFVFFGRLDWGQEDHINQS